MSPEEWNREVKAGTKPGGLKRHGDEPNGYDDKSFGLPQPGHPTGWSTYYADAAFWLVSTANVPRIVNYTNRSDRYMSFKEAVKAAKDLGPKMCCGSTRVPTIPGSSLPYDYYLGLRWGGS